MSDRTADAAVASFEESTVRDALQSVTDPELDHSIVALEYVDSIEIDGAEVTLEFTLPTAWCSPAFAWMMAVDARDAIESLPAVETATVVLREHMHDAEINRGVNERRSFEDAFPDADGGIDGVRANLDEKARVARQYDAVETLIEAGFDPETIVSLRLADLERLPAELADESPRPGTAANAGISDENATERIVVYAQAHTVGVVVPAEPIERYLEKARATGVVSTPENALFRTPEGETIPPDSFELVHRRGRLTQVNMSGQAGICDGLNEARKRRVDSDGGE
ncbi:iron-sulfur cluster assembly protein [Natrarchaeobius sp. A-rgal3]|uniref:iron-sulfur cluster assembly protein n=1 Tax=Natrarchaeobius versutus TaxID=1679078 RepID=UPI00350EECF0